MQYLLDFYSRTLCAASCSAAQFPLGREPVNLKHTAKKMAKRISFAKENAQLVLIRTKIYGMDRQIKTEGRDGCQRLWPVGLEECSTKTS
jgi:hypothetical protein